MNEMYSHLVIHDAVRNQIRIFDEIFDSVGRPHLFNNPDIEFDNDWCSENYLKLKLFIPNNNSVALEFYLDPNGMRIDFEDHSESWEASAEYIDEQGSKVKEVLERLITNHILVEYKGNARFVNLFNHDGSKYSVWSLQSFLALIFHGYWKSQSIDQHLFSPIYSRKNK